MSVHVSSRVWKLRDIPPAQKLILLKLADHADDNGQCWPSLQRIADETCLSRSTVCDHLATMEAAGWIARQPGGEDKTTRYTLTLPDPEISKTSVGGVVRQSDGGSPPVGRGVVRQSDTNHQGKTTIEPSKDIMVPEAPKSGQRKQIRDRTADELALARLVAPDMLASDVFKAAWTAWQGYREERATRPLSGENRAPWTERAASAALKNLMHLAQRYGDNALTKMVARSIDRRWLEVYEPKGSDSIKASTSTMTEDQLKNF